MKKARLSSPLLRSSTSRNTPVTGLTFSTLGKIFSRRHFEVFFLFFPEKQETICMKCQILFSGKNKKNIINWPSAENSQRVVKVKVSKDLPLAVLIRYTVPGDRCNSV